jgi:outer membrane protein assembly factor BamB
MFLWLGLGAHAAVAQPAEQITPRTFPEPEVTEWQPRGCRSVPFSHPALLPRTAFRRAHADLESSDEVELAYPPVFAREWIAEPSLYQVTTPSFDSAGNLYMTPLLPHEPILLISLDAETGARRFVVPLEQGDRGGGAVPVVLRDPETGTEAVYINRYQRMLAVRTGGTTMWNVPTGLGPSTGADQAGIGLAWVPNADAIVGLTRDGFVFLLDRRTGEQLLPAPVQLPGERTPPRTSTIPPSLADLVDELLEPLVAFPAEFGVLDLIDVLLGGNSEVANNLSVDPRNNRLWIAATARDEEDGETDGVSEFGAIYRIDVVPDGDGWALNEVCHRTFSGGSASTPTLGQNGTRVYLGDDSGSLIAIDADDCEQAWSVPLDLQIFGSIAVSADGRELYAASAGGIFQVFDDGEQGRRGWTAELDLYEIPPELTGYGGMNLLLTGIGANGLLIQAGVGLFTETNTLPVRTGIVHVDRMTGEPRWFADDLEESLGAMSTGPDGALYLPHAPLRRAFSVALGLTTDPLVGGVSKWSSTRNDLLARDAACAAADRAGNALVEQLECPASATADMAQVDVLRLEMAGAAERAVADGDLDVGLGRRILRLSAKLGQPPGNQSEASTRYLREASRYPQRAARLLEQACRLLSSAGGENRARSGQQLRNGRDR